MKKHIPTGEVIIIAIIIAAVSFAAGYTMKKPDSQIEMERLKKQHLELEIEMIQVQLDKQKREKLAK